MPIFCEEIFTGIDEKKKGGDEGQYEVHFSSTLTFCSVILSGVEYCVQQLELMLSFYSISTFYIIIFRCCSACWRSTMRRCVIF